MTGIAAAGPNNLIHAMGKQTYKLNKPLVPKQKFSSEAVEEINRSTKRKIADPKLAWMFENCFENTLDTKVESGTYD